MVPGGSRAFRTSTNGEACVDPRFLLARPSRRRFLAFGLTAALAPVVLAAPGKLLGAVASAPQLPDPEPRPGIDASRVLTAAQLKETPGAIAAFDDVRQIPQIADGIRCNCGCAEDTGKYSLLSCYEADAMARACVICQGQGRMAFRLHGEGKTLAEIRKAIRARYE